MIRTSRQLVAAALKRLGLYGQLATRRQLWRYRRYARWTQTQEPQAGPEVAATTRFSIIVPTHKYTARYLEPLIGSVVAQSYPHWELILVNACENPADAEAVDRAAGRDKRIRVVQLPQNLHISGNTNAGIEAASGEFTSFLDHDDTLAPFALAEMAAALADDAAIDLFYSDEDKLTDDGSQRFYAFFKPELDRELILTSNYICHFFTARTALLKRVGGLRPEFDGAQDYDLVLRLLDHHPKAKRIPRMSYHWRMAESSTAVVISEKNYASAAGEKALTEYLKRQGIAASVEGVKGQPTAYRVKYPVPPNTRVAVVAGPGASLMGLPSSTTRLTVDELRQQAGHYDVAILVQAGVQTHGDAWASELVGKVLQPGVGVVSAAVLDARGAAPLGYVLTENQLALLEGHITHPEFTYVGLSSWPRQLLAVASGCFAVRMSHLAGLDFEVGPEAAASLSLALRERGLANVFWPYAQVDRGSAAAPAARLTSSPDSRLPALDPWFHPALTVRHGRADLKNS